ncbi:MAG: alpha/beta hydrolase, partial [Pseudohongiellaceae bacterium]
SNDYCQGIAWRSLVNSEKTMKRLQVFCTAMSLLLGFGASIPAIQAQSQQENTAMTTASPVAGVRFRFIETNGIRMRVAEAGSSGPLIILAHGWPESWYSWRHQIPVLANAGYRVVAPDMRGYGSTDAPPEVNDYDIVHLTADMVGIVDSYGEEKAIIVGHDWGSIVAWQSVLLHPDRFSAMAALSVPYGGRPSRSPVEGWRERYGDNFYYILYHQEPGVAEAEYDADPRGLLSRLYLSPDSPRHAPLITDRQRSAGGWIGRLGAPMGLPDWLTQDNLDYVVQEFSRAGFRGGVNYYRNFQRNWEITPQLAGVQIHIPVVFIAGQRDSVIAGATAEQLTESIGRVTTDLRGVNILPAAGHWIQQELPDDTNRILLEFLERL